MNYIISRDNIVTSVEKTATARATGAVARTSSPAGKMNSLHHESTSVVIDRGRTYSDAEYVATILRAWTSSCDTSLQARAVRREVEHFLDLDTRVSPSPNNILAVACLDCLAALETNPRKFFNLP